MSKEKMNILREQLKENLASVQAWKDNQEKCYHSKQRDLLEKNSSSIQQTGKDLDAKTERFSKLYKQQPHQKCIDSFIYQNSLEDMFKEEDAFTMNLTKYAREQLSGGVADLASGRDKSKYQMLDTSKPETFLIKGTDLSVKNREREELNRLQSAYLVSK